MQATLSGPHQKVYQRVFAHPMPHNLPWREVWSMLGAMPGADAVEDGKGNLKVARNGQTLVLHRARGKDLADRQELMQVRHFLERSEMPAPRALPAPTATAERYAADAAEIGTHLLVVIDHREARIYSTEVHGSVPRRITPYDPFGYGRALHYKQDDSNGQRKPERTSFYEAVAKTLAGARQVLLFGAGTGASSAMEQLLVELKRRHKHLAERVVGSIVVDEHHLSEDQLLAKARELFIVA
jgi:hypothetical protein